MTKTNSATKTLAILVGGGPAPGINAVIAAATIGARNHGARVLGCHDGYRWLIEGDTSHVEELEIADVSRIHFEGGSVLRTSRTNASKSAETLQHVVDALERLGVTHLLTIGGDDTAFDASRIAEALGGRIAMAHVPKTIDNDLPLPPEIPTFGFTTAVNVGKDLMRNLMNDAATTGRWFFVTVMGRRTGHLALGIGGSAGATLTVIGEEFPPGRIELTTVADILEAAIIKRRAQGRDHGVAVLAEGLLERFDPEILGSVLGSVERDPYGNLRLAEAELSRVLKQQVTASLRARNLHVGIVHKELGYELRCAPPGAFDIQYCRSLGYWATEFLLGGGSDAMVTVQGGRLVPMPFRDLRDPTTGRTRVRYVDVGSDTYRTLRAYMIRLTREDVEDRERVRALARAGALTEAAFVERFGNLVEIRP